METPALRAIILMLGIDPNPFLLKKSYACTILPSYSLDYIGKHFPVNRKKENVFLNLKIKIRPA
jgi:hypothetical protein